MTKILKENIEILTGMFSRYGLEIINVTINESLYNDDEMTVLLEVLANDYFVKSDDFYDIKINAYDENGELITVGSRGIYFANFDGYDTKEIRLTESNICNRAAKVRIYIVK